MNATRTIIALFGVLAVTSGCGGSSPGGNPGGAAGAGGGGGGGGSGTGGNGHHSGPLLPADAKLGTYIVLGDAISDNGGTDGTGDFATVQCGPAANITPSVVQNAFAAWNTVIVNNADTIGAGVYDMHADFQGHGYNNSDPAEVWFNSGDALSCLLPNAKGHDEIRREVYKLVTGEAIP